MLLILVRSWFKGADTVVINKFLEAKFTALLGSHDFGNNVGYIQQVDQCLRDANDFMTSLYRAGLFITLKRLKHLVRVGQSMVKGYSQCANLAFRSNLARFKFNPKYHMLCHIIYSLTQELAARRCPINPLAYSCQMPEDFINRVATLSRGVSPKTVAIRTLELYRLAVGEVIKAQGPGS